METGQVRRRFGLRQRHARLVAAGSVSPVNVNLVPNYKTIFADLKNQPYNTSRGSTTGSRTHVEPTC